MKQIAVSFGMGILITILPFTLVHWFSRAWWKSVTVVCDWPMVLAQHHCRYLASPNELARLVIFISLNIVTWAVVTESAYLVARRINKQTAP